ncbi:MAG: metal-dependent hydrolase, partial [Gallionellaceae bacterium]|nr:metal-dependent hydrolase [Gallionellaceae bacterium]
DMMLFMGLANLPDIDFLIGYIVAADVHAFHQGPTHSVLFAVIAGCMAALIWRRNLSWGLSATVFTLTILSHDLVDIFTGPMLGLHPSYGVPLLWPFYIERVVAPVTLLPSIQHDTLARFLSWHNAAAMLYEVAVFGLMAGLVFWRFSRRT